MRIPLCCVSYGLLAALTGPSAPAQDPLAPSATHALPKQSTGSEAEKLSWNIRVEVLMVALPQEKALLLLPALRDEQKIDGAVGELLAMVAKKEAMLMGWPMIWAKSGTRASVESI